MDSAKPKPCPFCGGYAILDFAHKEINYTGKDGNVHTIGFYYNVRCSDIFCGCKIGLYEDPYMAVEAWNRRAKDAAD